jgi:hypothetical protein
MVDTLDSPFRSMVAVAYPLVISEQVDSQIIAAGNDDRLLLSFLWLSPAARNRECPMQLGTQTRKCGYRCTWRCGYLVHTKWRIFVGALYALDVHLRLVHAGRAAPFR